MNEEFSALGDFSDWVDAATKNQELCPLARPGRETRDRIRKIKPAGTRGRLPGIIALNGHDGVKFFGKEKIAEAFDWLRQLLGA
jgi:hypothetical protein